MTTLHAQDVAVTLGGRAVLHGVDATFAPGWTAIVGPNGAGKSTLLRALAGLLVPERGRVLLDGQPLHARPARERARQVAWLTQSGEVSGELTVRETVALGRLPHLGLLGTPGPEDQCAIAAAMAATACAAWAERRLAALSGGERQRVWLARALATEAPVLLLDEPTTHLDVPHQVALARLLRAGAGERTVVAIVHDLSLALAADRLLVLDGGTVRAHGPAHDPALHRALEATFHHAVRITQVEGEWVALAGFGTSP